MATWQQSINSGGFLAGIGAQNENAPKASDVNETLAYIRQNNEDARLGRNNIGLQALQGITSTMQGLQQYDQQKQEAAFRKDYASAIQSGDRQQVRDLMTKYPGQLEKIQSGMKWADEDQRNSIGTLAAGARLAASSPEAMQSWLQNNAKELTRVGVDPNNVAQMYQQNPSGFGEFVDHLGMAALGPIDYFNVQDKMAGREIDRGRLAETIRSNQAGEALQARGQNLSYQSAMTGHGLAAERLALDKQKFGFEVQQAQKKADELINAAPKLSVNMEKAIEKSAGDAAASRNAADSMTTLADTLEKEKPTPGLFGNAENMFTKLTGQDNYLRDMRIRFNQLANAQATKLLPPGPASDKDIEFARKGIPSETDNPMVMARWLRGMAKMESNNAKFNEFRSEWMSANGSPGQSDRNRNIMGMDVKKGESLNSAAKRFLSSSYGDSQPQQQLSDDELISKYLGGQ
ncbi:acyltransferase [Escherichia fergusonii]|nr:acyltransferase [Escherichia coli]EHG7564037.1 acyltransferase [Escherichia fergusonii]EFA4710984.1 acyltransferase [Escherichia coli]EFA5992670.1 acyltransferase [Escherichia coli]EFD0861179.1 acyltransferase [Escherichia coli]